MSAPRGAVPGATAPPEAGRWDGGYALVIVALAAEIAALAWLTGAFR